MRHPWAMPDQLRRIMLAVIDAAGLKQLRRGAHGAEARQMLDAVNRNRPRKALWLKHVKAAIAQGALAGIDIAGLKHQPVQTARAFEHVLAHDVRARWQADEF